MDYYCVIVPYHPVLCLHVGTEGGFMGKERGLGGRGWGGGEGETSILLRGDRGI